MSELEISAAIARLRAAALDQTARRGPGPDELIRLGLNALLVGADTPSLRMLAGLGRNEAHQARDLFAAVIDELGLSAPVPDNETDALWLLARQAATAIIEGSVDPVQGAYTIWQDFITPLDYPPALIPLLNAIVAAYAPGLDKAPGDQIRADIMRAAADLIHTDNDTPLQPHHRGRQAGRGT
jgi:hypothetical protein